MLRSFDGIFCPLGKIAYYIKEMIVELQKQHIGGKEGQIWYLKAKLKQGSGKLAPPKIRRKSQRNEVDDKKIISLTTLLCLF